MTSSPHPPSASCACRTDRGDQLRPAAPGAGAAGAIVLALAAACAAKAASIALKHRPDDAELIRAVESFAQIARRAVSAADADAAAFERFLHEKKPNQAWQLILTDETLVQLSKELIDVTNEFDHVSSGRSPATSLRPPACTGEPHGSRANIAEAKASSAPAS